MDRWVNSVAVVTGASAGIGEAISIKLCKIGIKVVGLARRQEKLNKLVATLQNEPGKFWGYKTDISKEEEILAAFQWIKNNVGPVSILINNAGLMKTTNLSGGNVKMWKAIFDTNVLGLCIATREAIESMKVNKIDGHIVHINSIAGHIVPNFQNMNVYCASKHAVTALTETLRQELACSSSKIKVTSVSPGMVDTEIFDASGQPFDIEKLDLKILDPEDVADTVLYTLSTPPHVQIHEMIIRPVGEMF